MTAIVTKALSEPSSDRNLSSASRRCSSLTYVAANVSAVWYSRSNSVTTDSNALRRCSRACSIVRCRPVTILTRSR